MLLEKTHCAGNPDSDSQVQSENAWTVGSLLKTYISNLGGHPLHYLVISFFLLTFLGLYFFLGFIFSIPVLKYPCIHNKTAELTGETKLKMDYLQTRFWIWSSTWTRRLWQVPPCPNSPSSVLCIPWNSLPKLPQEVHFQDLADWALSLVHSPKNGPQHWCACS